jgi:D-alanine transaminase
MNDSLCYLNGVYQPLSEAKIPVLDRGFIFGDGVYEVVPVYGKKLFRFDQHIARLSRSLSKIGMSNPMPRDDWLALARKLVEAYAKDFGENDQMVYIQVTRGVAKRDHAFPKGVPQTVFAMTSPLPKVSAEARAKGVACVSASDFRWHKGDIKSTSLLGAVLARQMSAEVGAVETILFRDGYLTEASASNVWVVKHGVLAAPVKDNLKLEGIRYGLLEELCAAKGLKLELRPITEDEVRNADELILTSATKEVLPVTVLDGKPIGTGAPGPIYAKTYEWYQEAKQAQCI